MKNWIIIGLVAAVVALVLGIITQLVGHTLILSAAGWNGFAQTLLLITIALGVLQYVGKKE